MGRNKAVIPTVLHNCTRYTRENEAGANTYKMFDAQLNIPTGIISKTYTALPCKLTAGLCG
jgi:hypothetical protein